MRFFMKKSSLSKSIIASLLILCLTLPLFACSTPESPEPGTSSTTGTLIEENPDEPVKEIPLIENGKSLFRIVRNAAGIGAPLDAALLIRQHLKDNGVSVEITTDWADPKPDIKEILIGKTAYTPESPIDIELADLGQKGYIVMAHGNKILLLASNDEALVSAAEHLKTSVLDFSKENITIPENYCFVSSNGVFLTEFKLAGNDISDYSIVCENEMFDEGASVLKELIRKKCGVKLKDTAEHKILLTSESANGDNISVKFENGDLIIRAKDAAVMQKALACFWFENIAYEYQTLSLPSELSYSKDLTKTVFYSDFGADATGSECCLDEIIKAHDYANENGYKVFADLGAKYYVSSTDKTAKIKTDVEWGNADITIDDSEIPVEKRGNQIFEIASDHKAYNIDGLTSIDRDVNNLGITLPQKSIVTLYDSNTIYYIRSGGNANAGQQKLDIVVVDKDGSIDMNAPLMWDFDKITSISVRPIDETTITVSGGIFTTIANKAPSEYNYYARGINISRSNTNVKNVTHLITGEGKTGAPYSGFFFIANCAYVNFENCIMSGHKTYKSPTTYMGSYDIGAGGAISVTFKDCTQANDINDSSLWGIMGTNYCKNLTYDGCILSRFDAHQGVANATIKNSIIGHGGASVIGYGTLLIENSKFYSKNIIGLRSDYGSSWEGELIIRNCEHFPFSSSDVYIISGVNYGTHNYGYTCYMPENITIDGLYVDSNKQIYVFSDFNPNYKSEDYAPAYPHIASKKVTVKNFTSDGSDAPNICPNQYIFADTEYSVE